jgi:AcrR family transcriptional regulator
VSNLRESKKQRTRAAIQRAALELVEQQGYARTTVEQIASAADVSPATFFRYFPTKEAALVFDEYDELLREAGEQVPHGLSPLRTIHHVFRAGFEPLGADIQAGTPYTQEMGRRMRLVRSEPALRAAMRDLQEKAKQELSVVVAAIAGRGPDDLDVRVTVAAALAVAAETMDTWLADGAEGSLPERLDAAFDLLENGLALPGRT